MSQTEGNKKNWEVVLSEINKEDLKTKIDLSFLDVPAPLFKKDLVERVYYPSGWIFKIEEPYLRKYIEKKHEK